MRKIDRIYLTTYRLDSRLTRICIGSIRYFYPDIPIYLIVDETQGPVPEREFADAWGVQRKTGIPALYKHVLSQLQVYSGEPGVRFFLMDADIVFAGRVLDVLEKHDEGVVVEKEVLEDDQVYKHFLHLERMAELDPEFRAPGWWFNSGQWVGTSGQIVESDWAPWLTQEKVPGLRHPETFYQGQGLLNYLVMKKRAEGLLTIGFDRYSFWMGGNPDLIRAISLERIQRREYDPILLHWAGVKRPKLEQLPRADILQFFELFYYSRIGGGAAKKWFDIKRDGAEAKWKMARRRVQLKTGRGWRLADKCELFLYAAIRKRPGAWGLLSRFLGKGDWCITVKTPNGPARVVFNPLEPMELSVVDELLYGNVYLNQRTVTETFVDCGAFRGISTIYLQDQARASTVEAYEPNDVNFAVLQRRLAKYCPKAKALHAAVGAWDGEALFSGDGVGGKIRPIESPETQVVQQLSLRANPAIARAASLLLKVDVEGEEEQILPELLDALPTECTMFLETHGLEKVAQDLVRPYRKAGFDVRMRRIRKDPDSGGSFIDWELARTETKAGMKAGR